MSTIVNMPGSWIRDEEMEEELFIPPLRLPGMEQRMEQAQIRTSTPYPTHQEQFVPQGLRIPARNPHRNQRRTPYPNTPPNELFIPGFEIPPLSPQHPRSQQPVSNMIGEELLIPRLSLRVDTLTMQDSFQNVPSSARQHGEHLFNSPTSHMEDVPPTSRRSTVVTASPRSQDELFFDCPSPVAPQTANNYGKETSLSYVPIEPEIMESDIENTNWQLFEPPAELRRPQEDTSVIIESILVPSIIRILQRHDEEEERRAAAAAMSDTPLGQTRGASVNTFLSPLSSGENLRPESISDAALSPNDSGYGSTSPGTEYSTSPPSPSRRSFGGISSLFKRNGKPSTTRQPSRTTGSFLDSQPLRPAPASFNTPPAETLITECVSCLDDFEAAGMVKLECHSYCQNCFGRLINNAMESEAQWPAKCCLNEIPSDTIITNIDGPMKKKYRKRKAEWSISISDRIYCAQPNCSSWIDPKDVDSARHSAKCRTCGRRACTICRGPVHNGADCPSDNSMRDTIALAEIEGWKRCYSCNALVEHNKGCRHMTCRCKAQFCYICGLRWRTCACTEEDLVRVQRQADARRQDHRSRTAIADAEAEEEREILAEVAAFIQREQEEAARIAEEERQAAQEARRVREEARIRAISLRYHEFNNELEFLHDLQRVPIAERHEFEQDVLRRDRENALKVLAFRHPSEQEAQEREGTRKFNAAKHHFETEYQGRREAEKRIEDDYLMEMEKFWAGKPQGEDNVREAREKYRQTQNGHYELWNSYQKDKLRDVREREEMRMKSLKARQVGEVDYANKKAVTEEVEWRRRRFAERKWVHEIINERKAMLRELEQEEYARGGEMM